MLVVKIANSFHSDAPVNRRTLELHANCPADRQAENEEPRDVDTICSNHHSYLHTRISSHAFYAITLTAATVKVTET